jgi:hypothetical protein
MLLSGAKQMTVSPTPYPNWANQFNTRPERAKLSFAFNALITASLAGMVFVALLCYGMSAEFGLPLALLAGLTGQQFVRLAIRRGQDFFEPTTLIAGYFMLYFCLRTIYLFYEPSTGHRLGMFAYDDYIPQALWCGILAFVCFILGFQSKWTARLVRLPLSTLPWPSRVPAARIVLTTIVGFGASVYLFNLGYGVGNYANLELAAHPPSAIIVMLQRFLNLGWIATCVYLFSRKHVANKRLTLSLVVLSLLFIGAKIAITGSKSVLLEPLIESLIVYNYVRQRVRVWQLATIAIPAILLTFGLINFYRLVIVGGTTGSSAPRTVADVGSRVSSAADHIGSGSTGARRSAFEQLLDRQAGVDALAVIMKATPHDQPFRYGRTILDGLVSAVPIPRLLWPGKPVYNPSGDFEQNYLGRPWWYIGFTSMGIVPDLYRNFYLFGVIGGMFLLGLISKAIYLICRPESGAAFGVMLYAAVLPGLFRYMEQDAVSGFFSDLPRLIILVLAVGYFLGVRYRSKPARRRVPAHTLYPYPRSGAINSPQRAF